MTTTIHASYSSACDRLVRHAFTPHEFPSLVDTIFSSEDEGNRICSLRKEDAQVFVDVMDEALDGPELPQQTWEKCLKLLYRTCGRHELLPKSWVISVCYDITGDAIYKGGCADIRKGRYRGQDVAVKVVRTYSDSDLQKIVCSFCKEAVTWKFLRHPNVLPLMGVAITKSRFAMISSWMANGNINDFVKSHPEVDRFGLLVGVTRGLIYIHTRGMIHGDLKGSNILIDPNGNPCIADFGLLTVISSTFGPASYTPGGTARWMSPELVDPQRFRSKNSCPTIFSDCYALGMVIYETISGHIPFHEEADMIALVNVLRGEIPPRGKQFADSLWKMLKRCWARNPKKRPSIGDVLQCLERAPNASGATKWWILPSAFHKSRHQQEGSTPPEREPQEQTLCQQCKKRLRFRRFMGFRKRAKVYPYCGRTCAKLAADNGSAPANPRETPQENPQADPQANSRENTQENPRESTRENPRENTRENTRENPRENLPTSRDAHPAPLQPASSDTISQTSGCSSHESVQRGETSSNYRTMAHEKWRDHGCIACRAAPMINAFVLCQHCHNLALSMAPGIIEVPEDHKNYKDVEQQFTQSWRHNTVCPEVKAVYKIVVTEASMNQYQHYLDNVEARGNFAASDKPRGNENRRWHGTRRKCNLGDPGKKALCADLECSLCCIIKESFDLKFYRAATGWGRFGQGIYTSSTSSKCNDYSENIGIASEWKALLLNKVVVGNGMKLIQDDESLTQLPPEYDSVLAEVVPGGTLNYDELVLYKNEAIRPSYLVIYCGTLTQVCARVRPAESEGSLSAGG